MELEATRCLQEARVVSGGWTLGPIEVSFELLCIKKGDNNWVYN